MVMNAYVVMIGCGLGAILMAAICHAYFYAPIYELKRRATRDNLLLRRLIKVSHYQKTGRVFFTTLTGILAISAIIAAARELSPIVAFGVIVVFILLLRYVLRKNSRLMVKLASAIAQYIVPVLVKLDPLAQKLPSRKKLELTKIYEKEDLKDVIQLQKKASNNRIPISELNNALHALDFGFKKIKDYMVSHKDIQFVTTKEPIGPILLSELHKSGFECFPVQGNSKHEIVGMLHMDDLAQHTTGGVVSDVMDTKVLYVPEDQNLEYVLHAFNQTGRQLFVVIDTHEKITGLISVSDVIEQILGHSITGDFENYDDPSAVAHS